MIPDTITKLESEAESDATGKAYCDEEMAKTESKKAELDSTIESLTTKIDALLETHRELLKTEPSEVY